MLLFYLTDFFADISSKPSSQLHFTKSLETVTELNCRYLIKTTAVVQVRFKKDYYFEDFIKLQGNVYIVVYDFIKSVGKKPAALLKLKSWGFYHESLKVH